VRPDDNTIDTVDRELLALLAEDARRTVASLASEIPLTPSSVSRRLKRLEKEHILKYTTVIAYDKVDPSAEAYVELTLEPRTNAEAFVAKVVKLPKIREASGIAGKVDALLRVRAESNDDISDVVNEIREMPEVRRTEILFALHRQRHVAGGRDAVRES
jgi:Lrp/AsnC family leucine-responsive transcriptional regulator